MKKQIESLNKKKNNIKLMNLVLVSLMIISCAVPVFADITETAGVTEFNKVIFFIAGWIARLGMVVGFFGAVQCAFGFKNDDADAKVKGLRTMISGFIVFAISNKEVLISLFQLQSN